MGPLAALALAGGGLGLGKHVIDQQNANRQRKAQSEIHRYSPWTGVTGQSVQDPNIFGNVMSGVAGGAMLGQGIADMQAAPAPTPTDSISSMQVADPSTKYGGLGKGGRQQMGQQMRMGAMMGDAAGGGGMGLPNPYDPRLRR